MAIEITAPDYSIARNFKVNGHRHYVSGINTVRRISNGRFLVINTQGFAFHAVGGRKAGGARNEWYIFQDITTRGCRTDTAFTGDIKGKSLVDVIRAVAFI